jgi:hypothetical protein
MGLDATRMWRLVVVIKISKLPIHLPFDKIRFPDYLNYKRTHPFAILTSYDMPKKKTNRAISVSAQAYMLQTSVTPKSDALPSFHLCARY